MCQIHMAAIVSELLRRKRQQASKDSCSSAADSQPFYIEPSHFALISPNIVHEEALYFGQQVQFGIEQCSSFSELDLLTALEDAAQYFNSADRFEMALQVYKMTLPYYERRQDWRVCSYRICTHMYSMFVFSSCLLYEYIGVTSIQVSINNFKKFSAPYSFFFINFFNCIKAPTKITRFLLRNQVWGRLYSTILLQFFWYGANFRI